MDIPIAALFEIEPPLLATTAIILRPMGEVVFSLPHCV
jgi:hypothetical protein